MGILQYREVTKRYGSSLALDHLDLDLEPGRIVGLLGPNGPGKETKAETAYLSDRVVFSDYMTAQDLVKMHEEFFKDFDRKKAVGMLISLGIKGSMKVGEMSKGTKEKL